MTRTKQFLHFLQNLIWQKLDRMSGTRRDERRRKQQIICFCFFILRKPWGSLRTTWYKEGIKKTKRSCTRAFILSTISSPEAFWEILGDWQTQQLYNAFILKSAPHRGRVMYGYASRKFLSYIDKPEELEGPVFRLDLLWFALKPYKPPISWAY